MTGDKLNVLYVETGSGYGGSSQSLYQLLPKLDRNRFRPVVAVYHEGGVIQKIRKLGVPVYVLHGPKARSSGYGRLLARWVIHELPRMMRLVQLIWRERVDLVHLNTDLYSTVAGLCAATLTGRPVVCHIRLLRPPTRVERLLGRVADHLIVLTQYAKMCYRPYWPKQQMSVVYNGVCLDGDRGQVNGLVMQSHRPPTFGLAARCVPGKGYEEFINAASLVHRQHPEVQFLIIGNGAGGDPSYETAMRQLAVQQGLNGSLVWAGWQDDLPQVLRRLNAVLQVSTTFPEGFGRVAIEAMACGTPVIATNLPVFSEVIGEAGMLVPTGDARALAKAIVTLLGDPALGRRLGALGRQRVKAHFSLRAHAQAIQQIYVDLLETSKRTG